MVKGNQLRYPLVRDLAGGLRYPPFEQLGSGLEKETRGMSLRFRKCSDEVNVLKQLDCWSCSQQGQTMIMIMMMVFTCNQVSLYPFFLQKAQDYHLGDHRFVASDLVDLLWSVLHFSQLTSSPFSLLTILLSSIWHLLPRIIFSTSSFAC